MTNDLEEVRRRVADLRENAAKKSAELDSGWNIHKCMWDTYESAYDIVLEIINEYQHQV